MKKFNFIFIGGSYRGHALFRELVSNGYIPRHAFILKEDDHEDNSLVYSEKIAELARSADIPYDIKKKLNKKDEELILAEERDFLIVCGWRSLINPDLRKSIRLGMVAAHDSLLPKYRGFAPLNWAIINGEKETGVTLFLINDSDVDSGEIIMQGKIPINEEDYAIDVFEKVKNTTVDLYMKFLDAFGHDQIELQKQVEEDATYTCKRVPADGRIRWNTSSTEVVNLVRALAPPFPGAFCFYNGEKYIVRKAALGQNNNRKYVRNIPGRVISTAGEGVEVMCGTGTVLLTEWSGDKNKSVEVPSVTLRSITATLE